MAEAAVELSVAEGSVDNEGQVAGDFGEFGRFAVSNFHPRGCFDKAVPIDARRQNRLLEIRLLEGPVVYPAQGGQWLTAHGEENTASKLAAFGVHTLLFDLQTKALAKP